MGRWSIRLKRSRFPSLPAGRTKSWEPLMVIAAGTVLTLALLRSASLFPAITEQMRDLVSDLQIAALPRPDPSSVPVIVVVDEKSLEAYGQWPWPRYRVAQLLEKLDQSGVAAVGIDILFAERDRSSPTEVSRELQRGFNWHLPLDSIPASARDYDEILATTLNTGPFVLSYFFKFDQEKDRDCRLKSTDTALLVKGGRALDEWQNLHRATGLLCSISTISDAAPAAGFINTRPDDDGIYRRTPLVMEWMGRTYPSLALQTLLTANHVRQLLIETGEYGFNLRIGDRRVPLDSAGNLLIRFRGPSHSYEYISALDILNGQVSRGHLQEKIVFLGIEATGLQEYRPIHYDSLYTGVEFHAAIVDNILTGDFLQRPTLSGSIEAGSALIIGVALSVLLAWSGPLISALIPVLFMIGAVASSQILLMRTGISVSPALTVLTILTLQLFLSLLKYGREKLKSEAIRRQIVASQEATIEGFCAMSEYRDPETGAHIKRTQNYVKALAEHLRTHPRFKDCLDDNTIELMYKAAPLHDVGKIGIPDNILLKPGLLNDEEFELMKKHTEYGAQVFEIIQKRIGENDFLRIAIEIILGHQEKWDGSGYPRGLSGEAIPVSARLMALADVYDALISRRVYKPPYPHYEAVKMIVEGKGKHFDPDVVEAFLKIEAEFKQHALRFLDSEEQRDALLRKRESTKSA